MLFDLLDHYLSALTKNNPSAVKWAHDSKISENNVLLGIGDGVWNTARDITSTHLRFSDPDTGGVGTVGLIREGGEWSPFCLRLQVGADGRIMESETIVSRPSDAANLFCSAHLSMRPEFAANQLAKEIANREEIIGAVSGYFDTLQRNDGVIRTQFSANCNRRENGVWTTLNPDLNTPPTLQMTCEESFGLGFFRFNDRVRDRRYPLVDKRNGLVLAAGFIDHSGKIKSYRLTDGSDITSIYQRPHSLSMLELFKVQNGKIIAIEAVFHNVPYNMPSVWNQIQS